MGNQAASSPNPSQTPSQAASPTTQTSPANAKTAADARRTAILAAYDILRPASEVDSRAQRVLVSALALIALCVVPDKPAAVNFSGLSFSLRHWLALAIPLCVVVLYSTAELALAWRIQWKRVSLVLRGSIVSVRELAYDELGPILSQGASFRADAGVMQTKRTEIWEWYEKRMKEINAQNLALEEKERFPLESFPERLRNNEALRQEFEQRKQQAGIAAFDEKVDQILKTGLDQNWGLIRQNEKAIEEMRRLLLLKKIRLVMGLVVPALISAFSLLTFAWATLRP